MWTISELKEKGWQKTKAFYWMSVLAALILLMVGDRLGWNFRLDADFTFGQKVNSSDNSLFFSTRSDTNKNIRFYGPFSSFYGIEHNVNDTENSTLDNVFPNTPRLLRYTMPFTVFVFLMAFGIVFFVYVPLIVGGRRYFARTGDEEPGIKHFAFAFNNNYLNIVKVMFIKNLTVFLWGLLLIVPGIIKSYEYCMVPYILGDDPTLSASEAKSLSRQMMDGEKLHTFLLGLSFIGWDIISAITLSIFGVFWLNPYKQFTFAELYKTFRVRVTDNNSGNIGFGGVGQ